MRQIAEIFQRADLRTAMEDGRMPKRKYEPTTKRKIEAPKRARYKLQVYYLDGNKRYYYSLDFVKNTQTGKYHVDEYEGLKWLMDYMYDNLDKIKTATLYAHIDNEPLTESKRYNKRVFTLGINHLKYYSKTETKVRGTDIFMSVTPLVEIVYQPRLSI